MRTISTLTLTALMLAAATTIVSAADLPSPRVAPTFVPPPVPIFSWTGFYVGGNAGYAFDANTTQNSFNLPNGSVAGSGGTAGTLSLNGNNRRNGFTGGGQIGVNYELGNNIGIPVLSSIGGFGNGFGGGLVVGVEADAQYLGIGNNTFGNNYSFAGTPGLAFVPVAGAPRTVLVVNGQPRRTGFFGTARGRLGIAIDHALIFGSGGFAYSDNTTGYAYGGGVEYAITRNVTVRAEYLRVNLGNGGGGSTATATFNEAANRLTLNTSLSNRESFNVVRGAINFKFDSFVPAPVVARY